MSIGCAKCAGILPDHPLRADGGESSVVLLCKSFIADEHYSDEVRYLVHSDLERLRGPMPTSAELCTIVVFAKLEYLQAKSF